MGGHKIGLRDPVRLIFETVVTVQTSVGDEGGRSTEDWRRLLFGHFFLAVELLHGACQNVYPTAGADCGIGWSA